MASPRADRLDRRVDPARDHVLGPASAELTLVEYGSYACPHCHAAHQVVANLQDRFGDRLRYAYRHLPLTDRALATRAAELIEYGSSDDDTFWAMHDAVMSRSAEFNEGDLARLAEEYGVPAAEQRDKERDRAAGDRVREDAQSGIRSGARATPTFFINGRRYEGAWDEAALTEALLGSLGHRLRVASLDFARWGPSTGFLLVVMSLLAILLTNSAFGPGFTAFWHEPFGIRLGPGGFTMPLLHWVNDGLLTVFFLVVGLEIKRELTIGRLASARAAALPIAGALGGMTVPALLYLSLIFPAAFSHGWGITIATDTAFAVALIVLLGKRVPVDLRVFLTAAVIVDDLVAIGVVALFYSDALVVGYLVGALCTTALMIGLNRSGVYRPLPYVVLGLVLWACLHSGGVHATLAGVILALVIPTRPPANLPALLAQAQSVLQAENVAARGGHPGGRLSHDALSALDVIHDRIDSPASKVLRAVEPWSSYVVLPIFALANAGVAWSPAVMEGRGALAAAIVVGLVVGKPVGILAGSWLAVRVGLARKPGTYTWRQLLGAGALGGIGFTMSLFIAGQAFPAVDDFAAAKIAVFLASLLAAGTGAALLWKHPAPDSCRLPTSQLPEGDRPNGGRAPSVSASAAGSATSPP